MGIDLIIGIVGSIIAATLIALMKFGMKDHLQRRMTSLRTRWMSPLRVVLERKGTDAVSAKLVTWLKEDQYQQGPRAGQFGKRQDIAETIRFDPNESPRLKPRLYQTSWACIALRKHSLLPAALERARISLERLMVTGSVMAVMPAKRPEKVEAKVSVRHTLRAAHTLMVLVPGSQLATSVLRKMLDPGSRWECKDGGWPQHESARPSSDLWASVYAIDFLDYVHTNCPGMALAEMSVLSPLQRTVAHLAREWQRNRWAYQGAPAAENVIHILNCVALVLKRLEPELLRNVTHFIEQWITAEHHVSAAYLRECETIQLGAASARFAYFWFLVDRNGERWRTLYQDAIEHFELGMDASDVAFLLDLTNSIKHTS
ncbi:MAG: hypothetical protein HY821_09960 [Acidobacteria bacterium]|nr:hypothetical protein [Acidobacteriota bacterium]